VVTSGLFSWIDQTHVFEKRQLKFLHKTGMISDRRSITDHADRDFPMRRFTRPSPPTTDRRRRGSGSIDFVLILGVVLPLVAFVLPASRIAIQASFAWFCRITTSPFL
jgi:hypothetical protein